MNKIIHSIDLTKIYGEKETSVTALDNINVDFKENELFPELKIVEEKKYGISKILFCKF